MAAPVSFLQSNTDGANATTYTYSSENLGTADSERYIIVTVGARGLSAKTLDSVTIGGVTADLDLNVNNGASNTTIAAVARAKVPTGTTGDVVLTFSGGMLRTAIGVYRTVGISETPTSTDTSTADDPSGSINVAAGGFAVGTAACNADATTTESWTGLTEDYGVSVEDAMRSSGASDDFATEQTGLTVTCSFSNGINAAGAFISYEEEAAAAADQNAIFFGANF